MNEQEKSAVRSSLGSVIGSLEVAQSKYSSESEGYDKLFKSINDIINKDSPVQEVINAIDVEFSKLKSQFPGLANDQEFNTMYYKIMTDLTSFRILGTDTKVDRFRTFIIEMQMDSKAMKAGMKHVKEEVQHTREYV